MERWGEEQLGPERLRKRVPSVVVVVQVHKVRHRDRPDSLLAAAKICVLENDEDLDDFVVEIDILADISHENIIKFYEAFFYQNKLWVRRRRRKNVG